MAVKSRPGFAVSVDRTTKATEKKSVFLDIKLGQSVNLRFLPPDNEDGLLFFESAQHYKLKQEGQGRAWACLRVHGAKGQDCPVCLFLEAAAEKLDAGRYKSLKNSHVVSNRWHAQVIPLTVDGKPAEQLYVVGLSKGTAGKVSTILKMERDNRQPLITDPDHGQAVNITRNEKSGLQTRYEVMSTGIRVPLDELYPAWTEEFLNIEKAIGLRIADEDTINASIAETVGGVLFNKLRPDVELKEAEED